MTVPYWYDAPDVWDTLVLNDRPWPGVARVKVRRGRKWDRKEAGGSNGETQTFKGTRAADVDISVRVSTRAEWEALLVELELIEPYVGKAGVDPVSIGHAVSIARKVGHVQIEDIEGPDGDDGTKTITIKAFEFTRPTKKNGSGTAKAAPSHDSECQAAWEEHAKAAARMGELKALQDAGQVVSDQKLEAAMDAWGAARKRLQQSGCIGWTPPSANKDAAKP